MIDLDSDSKKLIFLYPHHETERTLLPQIIRNEYEVFISNDHEHLTYKIAKLLPSIIYINIDKSLRSVNWEGYSKSLIEKSESSDPADIQIFGITRDNSQIINNSLFKDDKLLSYSDSVDMVSKSILKTLDENDAKGRRKYVRAHCNNIHHASFSIKRGGSFYQGVIIDISTNGMACRFNDHINISNNTYLNDLQLRLDGAIMKIAGTVVASRKDAIPVYVIIFDYRVTLLYREKIQLFICHEQQREFEQFLKLSEN